MATLKGKVNALIPRRGRINRPVIVSHSFEGLDDVQITFGTPLQEAGLPESLVFSTSNGTFEAPILGWENFYPFNTGAQLITAVFDLLPIFDNIPELHLEVISDVYRASNPHILASNNEFNIQ